MKHLGSTLPFLEFAFAMSRDNHMEIKNKWFCPITKYFNIGNSKTSGTGVIKYKRNLDVLCDNVLKLPHILFIYLLVRL